MRLLLASTVVLCGGCHWLLPYEASATDGPPAHDAARERREARPGDVPPGGERVTISGAVKLALNTSMQQTACISTNPALDCAGVLYVGVYKNDTTSPPFDITRLIAYSTYQNQNLASGASVAFSVSIPAMSGSVKVSSYLADGPDFVASAPFKCDPYTWTVAPLQLTGVGVGNVSLVLDFRLFDLPLARCG